MNTTLNIQHSVHSSREYTPPHLTIVEFKVEHCFQSKTSLQDMGLTLSSRYNDDVYYSTGEDYTEYTSDDGAFSSGSWI